MSCGESHSLWFLSISFKCFSARLCFSSVSQVAEPPLLLDVKLCSISGMDESSQSNALTGPFSRVSHAPISACAGLDLAAAAGRDPASPLLLPLALAGATTSNMVLLLRCRLCIPHMVLGNTRQNLPALQILTPHLFLQQQNEQLILPSL